MNARASQALTNYPAIFEGFVAKGIAEADIKPRENVFTFHAWKALGRSVKKGEHGVRVVTFIECSANEHDPATGEERKVNYRRPHTTVVFHISQTEPTADRDARVGAMSGKGWSSRPAEDRYPNSRWASGHGHHPPIDTGYPDPGELAADRWNETHGDKPGFREQLEAIRQAYRAEIAAKPVLSCWSNVLDYLTAAIAFEPTERFHLLFLDKRNRLIADEQHQHGTIDHVPVYPREVVKRALELGATAIILAHKSSVRRSDTLARRYRYDQDAGRGLSVARHFHTRPHSRGKGRPRKPQSFRAHVSRQQRTGAPFARRARPTRR